MAREMPTTVYTEVQIDEDSISLTTISESGSDGPVIEDTARWTFDELQSLSGEHRTLRLSRETRSALESGSLQSQLSEIFAEAEADLYFPDEGDVLIDDNPAPWSDDTRVVVEKVTDAPANEYVIQGYHEGEVVDERQQFNTDETVEDANPSYPADNRVVEGHYEGSVKTYAFPIDRLVQE